MLLQRPHFWLLISLLFWTSGCSLAPVISRQSVDYNATVEDVTSNLLVTNILRARDGAPLFFSDISQIRGSVSATLSAQTSFPFGPINRPLTGTGVRDAAQGNLSIVTNPTFDIAPSNTKQFYQGILQPVSKDVIAYYLQRGVEADWLFNLMISHVDLIKATGKQDEIVKPYDWFSSSDEYASNPDFVDLINRWYGSGLRPRVLVSAGSTSFGPPVKADARAIVEAKAADLDAEATKSGLVQFKKKAPKTNLCLVSPEGGGYVDVEIINNSIVKAPGADEAPKSNDVCNGKPDEPPKKTPGTRLFYRIRTRSVESMFYYLGALVRSNKQGPIPFRIHNEVVSDARFTVAYRDRVYSVSDIKSGDDTLTILAILNDLLNLNRDANEIPTTKAVQAVGSN